MIQFRQRKGRQSTHFEMYYNGTRPHGSSTSRLGYIRQHTPKGAWYVYFDCLELEPLAFPTFEHAKSYALVTLRLNGYKHD